MSLTKQDLLNIEEILDRKLEEKLENKFEEKLAPIHQELDSINSKFEPIYQELDSINSKFEPIYREFDSINSKLDNLTDMQNRLSYQFTRDREDHKVRIVKLEERVFGQR